MSEENPKYHGLLATLGSLNTPTLLDPHSVENRVYKNQRISLDGYSFTNCAFINCELFTSKGNFHMVGCYFNLGTVYFSENALRVVRLSALLLGNWGHVPEPLRPHVESDGGVTIP